MLEINNFDDWQKATTEEKEEFCFFEIKEAINSNDKIRFKKAFELMFWNTLIKGIQGKYGEK